MVESFWIILFFMCGFPLILGLILNWVFLPEGSTIKDLKGENSDNDSLVVPLLLYVIPGLNYIFITTMALVLLNETFKKITKGIDIPKILNNCVKKFISIKIK